MNKIRFFAPIFSMALLIVVSSIALVACSADQTQAAGGGSTPSSSATSTYRHPGGSTPAAIPAIPANMHNCGAISTLPNGKLADAGLAQSAGNCFWHAYQQCQPAGLFVQVGGIDTVTTHTFLITKNASGCAITDITSHRIVPQPPRITNYACTGMTNSNAALHITGCGAEGDVAVPIQ
ncbi:MAG TPA: hypothetical protein VKR06_25405 [Ktedonosporobacter sp.]|nr:hypothetical protein [Ktedonosporobacter sp.]